MKDIMIFHHNKYPLMSAQDFVKLIYQNEFGCGHFISDSSKSFERLKNELNTCKTSSNVIFEDIGNSFVRLYLSQNIEDFLSLESINNMFVSSAQKTGSLDSFKEKLFAFWQLCQDDAINLNKSEVASFLREYQDSGFPMLSHSEIYHNAYSPSYRVMPSYFKFYFDVISKIDKLLKSKDKLIIAIDGRCASGKSTLSDILKKVFNADVIPMDDFFLPPKMRTHERLAEAGGNVDYERFKLEVLTPYFLGKPVTYSPFSCQLNQLTDAISFGGKSLTIIDGSYSTHQYFGDIYDLKLFLTADYQTQCKRILNRNGEEMLKNFKTRWIPMEENYFTAQNTMENADIVIDTATI